MEKVYYLVNPQKCKAINVNVHRHPPIPKVFLLHSSLFPLCSAYSGFFFRLKIQSFFHIGSRVLFFTRSCCEGKPPAVSHCAGTGCILAWVPTKNANHA